MIKGIDIRKVPTWVQTRLETCLFGKRFIQVCVRTHSLFRQHAEDGKVCSAQLTAQQAFAFITRITSERRNSRARNSIIQSAISSKLSIPAKCRQ